MDDLNKLMHLIEERCDIWEVLDLAEIGMGELLLRFRGSIIANRTKFENYLDIYEYGDGDNDE